MTMELDGEIFAIHPQRDIHVIASAQNRTINRPRSDLVFTIIPMTPRHDDRVLVKYTNPLGLLGCKNYNREKNISHVSKNGLSLTCKNI